MCERQCERECVCVSVREADRGRCGCFLTSNSHLTDTNQSRDRLNVQRSYFGSVTVWEENTPPHQLFLAELLNSFRGIKPTDRCIRM